MQKEVDLLRVSGQIIGKIKPYSPDNRSQIRFVIRPAYTNSPVPISSSGKYVVEYSISNKKPMRLTITAESDLIIKKIA